MKGHSHWFVLLAAAVAAVALVTGAILGSDWLADYRDYRDAVGSFADPGQEPETSFDDFLKYRQAIAFYDAADSLRAGAAADEVRAVLGEPDRVAEREEEESWFYRGPMFRGRRQPTVVVDIDRQSSRVVSVGVLNHL